VNTLSKSGFNLLSIEKQRVEIEEGSSDDIGIPGVNSDGCVPKTDEAKGLISLPIFISVPFNICKPAESGKISDQNNKDVLRLNQSRNTIGDNSEIIEVRSSSEGETQDCLPSLNHRLGKRTETNLRNLDTSLTVTQLDNSHVSPAPSSNGNKNIQKSSDSLGHINTSDTKMVDRETQTFPLDFHRDVACSPIRELEHNFYRDRMKAFQRAQASQVVPDLPRQNVLQNIKYVELKTERNFTSISFTDLWKHPEELEKVLEW
jgi:hypothetical protein